MSAIQSSLKDKRLSTLFQSQQNESETYFIATNDGIDWTIGLFCIESDTQFDVWQEPTSAFSNYIEFATYLSQGMMG